MVSPIVSKQTNYLKDNVPYYKYYQSDTTTTDSVALFSSSTATVGNENCYSQAYSYKENYTSSSTPNFPSSGAGMTTPVITPSTYNNHDVTLSAWIKPAQSNQQSKTIWGCHADSTASGLSFGFDDGNPGKIKFHAKSYGGVIQSTTKLDAGNWYFVVCVYDRTNLEKRIYINGQLNKSATFSQYSDNDQLIFGYYIWKAGFWSNNGSTTQSATQSCQQTFIGQILNCCTWYRALTDAEITTLYNSGNGLQINTSVAPYTDVAIAYPLNETSGTTAYSAISGQGNGLYGSNTTYNQHTADSIFPSRGVNPQYLYLSGSNWETDLAVSTSAEFVSNLTLTRAFIPSKVTLTLNNTTPKNPVTLTIKGSTNNSSWTTLTTINVPSNTNQTIEQNITSSTEYKYYKATTDEGYTNTGLTIKNIKIDGYYIVYNEVGKHAQHDRQEQIGTHTVIGSASDYDRIEYQNKEYEVQNV